MKKILFLLLSIFTVSCFATEKLTVILDWFPNPDHAPLLVAQQQGFFKAQGLDVELIGPADPTDPPKWVAAKKADIGITYEPQLMEQIDEGLPLIRIGTLIDKPLNCLVALKDSHIQQIADLKGKRIGSSSGGMTEIMLKVLLAKQKLSDHEVELINVRYNLTQALLTHQVDAVSGLMRNIEIPQLQLSGHQVVTFFPEEYGVPTYSELVMVTHIENIHDPRLPKFLAALKQGAAYLKAHPQETWQQFALAYPESNNEVNRAIWFATMPYFTNDPANFNANEWKHFAQFMQEHHSIKQTQPISRYAVVVR